MVPLDFLSFVGQTLFQLDACRTRAFGVSLQSKDPRLVLGLQGVGFLYTSLIPLLALPSGNK